LKGAALDRFLLEKQGKHWDGVPVPGVSVADLDATSIARFRDRALRSKRIANTSGDDDDHQLLEKLHLTDRQYMKRASVLLFHPDPQRFVTGAYIKVGYFRSESDLVYQDEIHGNLFSQVDQVMDLLLTKYFKAEISYHGIQREETYPIPEAALREAVLNAVTHKDYSGGTPVQISVYPNKLIVWNEGQLPHDWTVERLMHIHPSKPFNPDLANAFFRAGLVESWGRGIAKILQACTEHGIPTPEIRAVFSGLWLEFTFPQAGDAETGKMTGKMTGKSVDVVLALLIEDSTRTVEMLMGLSGRSRRTVERAVRALKQAGRLRRVGSDKGGHWEIVDSSEEEPRPKEK
jgi:ATP-dependent DNA helicase RecG